MVQELKEYIDVIENGEETLLDGLNSGKLAIVERIGGFITEIELFNSVEELIERYSSKKEWADLENETLYYLTKHQAYLSECNEAYADYIDNFTNDNYPSNFDIEKETEGYRSLLSYDEFCKRFDENNFAGGFHDLYSGFLFPLIEGENTSHESEIRVSTQHEDNFNAFTEGHCIETIHKLEILFPNRVR